MIVVILSDLVKRKYLLVLLREYREHNEQVAYDKFLSTLLLHFFSLYIISKFSGILFSFLMSHY